MTPVGGTRSILLRDADLGRAALLDLVGLGEMVTRVDGPDHSRTCR